MKKLLILSLLIGSLSAVAQEKPKLVVGIVVDQMRQDYLFRFRDRFVDGGFNRLMSEGYYFKNAHYNYVPTYTAPGHASIYTGTTPSYHAIISNNWYDKEKDADAYCVYDESVSSVGGNKAAGKMSPKNLKASTITDELRLTTNFRSKVVGISIKDRGSILPAGHNPTGSYWFDSNTGKFITSTYYMDALPEWMTNFNKKRLANAYLMQPWEPLYPIEEYVQSTSDDVPYERPFYGQEKPVFPYNLLELVKKNGLGVIRTTPHGNSLMLDLALAAIEGEGLGDDEITDFLAISFSSTDYIGHAFGPNSIEVEDTYLRLDLEIKKLLDYLDAQFEGEYLVFLTADHGVVRVPSYLKDMKMAGGYLDRDNNLNEIDAKLNAKFGEGAWIKNISNNQIFLNHQLIDERGQDAKEIQSFLRRTLLQIEGISRVDIREELLLRNSTDPFKARLENGFNEKMSGDLLITLQPGYLGDSGYSGVGTTHGSGYTYDTHVPLLFFGQGINSGRSVRQVAITDIAPTLSMLLDVSLPSAATGQPLKELFDYDK